MQVHKNPILFVQGFVWENYETALKRVTFGNAKRVLRETEEYLQAC
jgi:hypothetical protein